MSGRPPGLSIKKPENTAAARERIQREEQKRIEERHKKHKKTIKNIREGKYGKTYLGENDLYHLEESSNNNNSNLSNENVENFEKINISRWTVVPSEEEEGGEFFEVPVTPNPSPPLNRPPQIKRRRRTLKSGSNNPNHITPHVKRIRRGSQLGGKSRRHKRRTQRKTSRRYN